MALGADKQAPPILIDSHCHLDLEHFDPDREAVLTRAEEAGVGVIVNPGIDLQHSRQAIALTERFPQLYAGVGLHPNSSDQWHAETLETLRDLARHPKVVAIGEIGLDYYWDKVDPAQQRRALEAQLDLAAQLGLPVIIHSRESNSDVAAILRSWVNGDHFGQSALAARPFAGVLHAFSGDLALAEEAYGWGFVLSLGGPVTFKNAHDLRALVPGLRLDRLMLETDAPYLTPHPWRGQRNEPARVWQVCQVVAQLMDCSAQTVAEQTTQVAEAFFALHPIGEAFPC